MPDSLPLVVENLFFRYRSREELALKDISLSISPGEVVLLAGASGCGKTTLMRCINGLIPRTYHGELHGDIRIFDQPVKEMSMPELSQAVGTLLQDPERQIVGSHVLNEVAFGLENLAIPRESILERADNTLRFLGIEDLKDRETFSTSGGEKQKIALSGVLVMEPKILLLDEPLASLDPASAQEALQLFRMLADDGIAVLIVEHRVEDVLSIHPDKVLYMEEGEIVYEGDVEGLMQVVDYRHIKLPAPVVLERAADAELVVFKSALPERKEKDLVIFEDVNFRYSQDSPEVLHEVNIAVHQGDVIAILGPNGAGKTTLVKHALGLLKPTSGRVLLEGRETNQMTVAQAAHTVGYVFQSPTQMLFAPTVEEELAFGPRNLRYSGEQIQENVDWAVHAVHMESELNTPPLALSFGQQKRVSIASILAMRSRILMMDEPTAGQDYWNYLSFMDAILQMPGFDAVLFITHDVDLAVIYANRILLMHDGGIAADGQSEEVMKDEGLLRSCRVLPTSLLKLNLELFPQTGRFMRTEELAYTIRQ